MFRSFLVILIFAVSIYSSCKKRSSCNQNNYNFQTNITASPGGDSIQLQDTLWFVIDDSVQLRDMNTNTLINFSNAVNLSFVFGIRQVMSGTSVLPAADSFHYYIKKGVNIASLDPSRLREYMLQEENGKYKLQVGFIPQSKGIFRVLVENSANVYTHDIPCDKASFAIKFINADQHFYLGYNISGEGVYYFKVY